MVFVIVTVYFPSTIVVGSKLPFQENFEALEPTDRKGEKIRLFIFFGGEMTIYMIWSNGGELREGAFL